MKRSALKSYTGRKAAQISFPLGGIGSGSVGLAGDGRLIDWEIFNKPGKGTHNGRSHFAVRAVSHGKLLDARVLQAELQPPYTGSLGGTGKKNSNSFGYGPGDKETGFPNFRKAVFTGEYPFAEIDFSDPAFPGQVRMTAFNPFIPHNDVDSSIPAAFFEIEFTNGTARHIEYSAAFSVRNPSENGFNRAVAKAGFQLIHLAQFNPRPARDSAEFGDMTFGTDADDVICQESWLRRTDWYSHVWNEFASAEPLPKRHYEGGSAFEHSTIMASVRLKPGKCKRVRFVMAWNYPNYGGYRCDDKIPQTWKNFYATLFKDSTESAVYALRNWDRLKSESDLFRRALHSSTIPRYVLETVSANISILKSATCLRLEDGSFWGWEGLGADAGSCEGTCSHVWNYAYAMPFLFPKLEQTIRNLNYKYNMRPDGGLVFRLQLPLGFPLEHPVRPCADGQFGDVIKVYREWKISGDTGWMTGLWPSVKKSIEFAWAAGNKDRWDPDKTGVLTGRQHHTLDAELFGPNSWLTGFYLAALRAGSEMAAVAGDLKASKEYLNLFKRGKVWVDNKLFNGEYYIQKLDLTDKFILEKTHDKEAAKFNNRESKWWYWNEEKKEIILQIGEGCGIDQVLAQWHANLCGLGEIFDRTKRRRALRAIYKHNFIRQARSFPNDSRVYSLNDEAGVVICVWPKSARKPVIPLMYHSETMYGFEYSLAALMIQEGLVKEGLEIVEKGRLRFDGERRNPWNEFECGSNYARSMSSFSLLPALSGFEYDMVRGMIGFTPVTEQPAFTAFWSLGSGWGTIRFSKGGLMLECLHGFLEISEFRSGRITKAVSATQAGKILGCRMEKGRVVFQKPVKIEPCHALRIKWAGGSAHRS